MLPASYLFGMVGTSRCDVRAACSGATPSIAIVAWIFVPPALSDGLRQCPAVRLNLPNRFDDVIHVPAVGQQQVLGHRDRCRADLPIAFQVLEALAVGFQPLGAEETLEAARVDRFVQQAVETSSPASRSMTCRLTSRAVVPLAVARQRLAPSNCA